SDACSLQLLASIAGPLEQDSDEPFQPLVASARLHGSCTLIPADLLQEGDGVLHLYLAYVADLISPRNRGYRHESNTPSAFPRNLTSILIPSSLHCCTVGCSRSEGAGAVCLSPTPIDADQ
ncbi:hypothetical protein CERSUDRAFT_108072, partial [Gelatoporia subvermispora B]